MTKTGILHELTDTITRHPAANAFKRWMKEKFVRPAGIIKYQRMLGKAKAKYIQSLGHKKHRDDEGLFIAEGPKLVGELLASAPRYIKEVYAVKDWLKEHGPQEDSTRFIEVEEGELAKLSQLATPNKVIAVVRKFEQKIPGDMKGKITLVLDTIQDPGNMGTIVRIADWFGITQLVCSEDCADVYNPKVVQATMGSIARVNVYYTSLVEWIVQQHDIRCYATVLEGKDVTKMGRISEGLVLIGNEARGIDPVLLEHANEMITIPKKGKAESLNAAVATGIILSRLATG